LAAKAVADHEKKVVAMTSVVAAVLLTGTKLTVGVLTGSLGILSEAAHSGLDLVAAGITLWAVRAAARPADREHSFGHGKFENLSALAETLLLLGTCVWIVWEAIARLLFHTVEVKVTVWSFAVILLSVVVDISRSRALLRVAKKHGSQALEADALHFSTDVWSSGVVLVGLAGVGLAPRLGLPWLARADAVSALAVAGIVVWVSLQLGKKCLDDLLDASSPEARGEILVAALSVGGVVSVERVRMRRSGPESFVDVTIAVAPSLAIGQAHAIADSVEAAVRAVQSGADVVVHVEPAASRTPSLLARELARSRRGAGARHGLGRRFR